MLPVGSVGSALELHMPTSVLPEAEEPDGFVLIEVGVRTFVEWSKPHAPAINAADTSASERVPLITSL